MTCPSEELTPAARHILQRIGGERLGRELQEIDGLGRFTLRVVLTHMVTYTIAGLLASTLFDYRSWWESEHMALYRPFDSPLVAAGPALQVFRGIVFAAVLYPFRRVFLVEPSGWRHLWALLVGLGIVSTYAAAIGSIEGLIYTRLPPVYHLFGLPEVVLQAGAFSASLVGWYARPHRAWGIVFGLLAGLAVLASTAGVLLGPTAGAP